MSNADIEFNVKLFENINSNIRSKDSIVTVNSEKFHNKDENRINSEYIHDRQQFGEFLFDNSKIVLKSKEIINNTTLEGNGRLEINTDLLKNRGCIVVKGEQKTQIGQYAINKNGVVKITANGLLDTYGNNIVVSHGLMIDAQQLKAKDRNIKIINKNKKVKPVVRIAELTDF
ncbi:MAG TPA: hypothetical protein ACHBX0_12170 [Arsenophonus sp.]